jgi:hypothetical protein
MIKTVKLDLVTLGLKFQTCGTSHPIKAL